MNKTNLKIKGFECFKKYARKIEGVDKMSFKVKAVIEQLSDRSGYIVTTDDGREFIFKNIDEAIKLKEELENESL